MTFVPRGEIFNVTSSSDGLDVSSQPKLRGLRLGGLCWGKNCAHDNLKVTQKLQ